MQICPLKSWVDFPARWGVEPDRTLSSALDKCVISKLVKKQQVISKYSHTQKPAGDTQPRHGGKARGGGRQRPERRARAVDHRDAVGAGLPEPHRHTCF